MLATLSATLLLVAACFALGQAVLFLCGWPAWRWWAPALGYAILMIVFGLVVHLRSQQWILIVLALVAVAASLALPYVRESLRAATADGLVLGIGLLLLAAIPFFAAGHVGILGANVSDDMSQHLTAAWWLHNDTEQLPVAAIGGDLITSGYPLGPHGLAAALAQLGLGDVRAFAAVTLAVPVITGFVAFGIVPEGRRVPRWALAAAIGLGYLPAAYLAQGSFKEIILAMLVLAVAVALGDLARDDERPAWRRAIPLGLIIGGAVYTYSYGALLWTVGAAVLFLAGDLLRRRTPRALVHHWAPATGAAVATTAVVVLPEIGRIVDFRNSIFGQEPMKNHGNLSHAINPLEALGVWFNGDFRFNPEPRWVTVVFCVIALAALAGGLAWWWRRRSLALPAAVVAALLVWAYLTQNVNIYNAAKGLLVLAPLVMACIGGPLVASWSGRAHGWTWLPRATGVVLFAGVVVASGGVLRSAPVGLGSHDDEFKQIRTLVRHKPVLFLDNDHFAQWELRGANPLYTTNSLYAPGHLGQHPAKTGGFRKDADNYGRHELDKVRYIVTPNGAYRSEIPPNFRIALRTPSYDVFQRLGPTPDRQPIEPPGTPGAVFDCSTARAQDYLKRFAWAGVLPRPVVQRNWQGTIARPGDTARMTARLPRGSWDVSLQYVSRVPVTLRGPGLTKGLAANFGPITSWWSGGTVTSDGRPVTINLTAAKRNAFARLLGRPRPTRAPLSLDYRPILGVAFTRHGATPRRTPARAACGRYVDWFAPAGSAMGGRSGNAG